MFKLITKKIDSKGEEEILSIEFIHESNEKNWMGRMIECAKKQCSEEEVQAVVRSRPGSYWLSMEEMGREPLVEFNRVRESNRLEKIMEAKRAKTPYDGIVSKLEFGSWIQSVENFALSKAMSKEVIREAIQGCGSKFWVTLWECDIPFDEAFQMGWLVWAEKCTFSAEAQSKCSRDASSDH